jgi:hypothetical protein
LGSGGAEERTSRGAGERGREGDKEEKGDKGDKEVKNFSTYVRTFHGTSLRLKTLLPSA